ncbi:P-loop containing nucleoside triphosphate hydrolase protein [Lineolata rhizophorae]|uniref:P-loop containing nucleoside triphosphate hydrolase protein n=1 Tax=Lineolata rhizophorae TaxID=578093 RepID=A0A6A6NQP8_9PEZI|nr:P-loop containing nucleoside triphosphate hydrolase protein [Lineolata rhizophorae]
MTGDSALPVRASAGAARPPPPDLPSSTFFHHSSAPRVNTDAVIIEALRSQYTAHHVTVVPQASCNLLLYASAGFARMTPLPDGNGGGPGKAGDAVHGAVSWKRWIPPARRLGGGQGVMAETVKLGKWVYAWKGIEVLLYVVDGRDGTMSYPQVVNQYIVNGDNSAEGRRKVDDLIKEATEWGVRLHNEVWVYDQGWWQKSAELWDSVQSAEWDDVILEPEMKSALISDVQYFFDNQDTYARLKVPWKRGIIYYGPPGNGKTISIKAMMHSLYRRKDPIPTLYVRTLTSFAGPEASLRDIFFKARQEAPCYLVFEDLDSIVSDNVRSYFLNEVDGLKKNDGILMVGSTNHLNRLDPGIAKRPSRFDRKYFFPDPSKEQRTRYARYWQSKLIDNDDIEFPDEMCTAVAEITDDFSFAYIQEAFVAALLAIATRRGGNVSYDGNDDGARWAGQEWRTDDGSGAKRRGTNGDHPELDHLVLWRELKKQVKILREEMEEKVR